MSAAPLLSPEVDVLTLSESDTLRVQLDEAAGHIHALEHKAALLHATNEALAAKERLARFAASLWRRQAKRHEEEGGRFRGAYDSLVDSLEAATTEAASAQGQAAAWHDSWQQAVHHADELRAELADSEAKRAAQSTTIPPPPTRWPRTSELLVLGAACQGLFAVHLGVDVWFGWGNRGVWGVTMLGALAVGVLLLRRARDIARRPHALLTEVEQAREEVRHGR